MKRINPTVAYFILVMAVMMLIWTRAYGQTPHTATRTVTSTACVTGNTCSAQLYADVIAAGSTCPAAGDSAYMLITNLGPATVSSTGSSWTFVDSRPVLTTGSVYCGYSTVTFTAGGGPSGASAIFQGQIPASAITPPPAPTETVVLK